MPRSCRVRAAFVPRLCRVCAAFVPRSCRVRAAFVPRLCRVFNYAPCDKSLRRRGPNLVRLNAALTPNDSGEPVTRR